MLTSLHEMQNVNDGKHASIDREIASLKNDHIGIIRSSMTSFVLHSEGIYKYSLQAHNLDRISSALQALAVEGKERYVDSTFWDEVARFIDKLPDDFSHRDPDLYSKLESARTATT